MMQVHVCVREVDDRAVRDKVGAQAARGDLGEQALLDEVGARASRDEPRGACERELCASSDRGNTCSTPRASTTHIG